MALCLCSAPLAAGVINVNVAELTDALENATREPDAVSRLVLGEIQSQLDNSEVQLSDGELIYTDTQTNRVVEDGCTNTTVQQVTTDIALIGNTSLSLAFESLFEPLGISLDLSVEVNAAGRAKQNFGVRLGRCVEIATDTFDFSATGPLRLLLDLSVSLNPQWINNQTLQITPVISIDGELREGRIRVDVDDSLLRSLIEDFLQDEVNALLGPGAVQQEIESLQQSIDTQLQEALGGANADGTLTIELPDASDDQIAVLYELLTPQSRFPLTESFIETYRLPLIAALILDDQQTLTDILTNAAECQLGGVLQTDLAVPAMYSRASGACERVTNPAASGTYYGDAQCNNPFSFVPTELPDFCVTALDSLRLGNAQSDTGTLNTWTLSPGTTFELGALSLTGKQQPLTSRVQYKSIDTAAGECALEIRVYSNNPAATNQRPVIALHGGSWQRRGSGFLGIEHMATHFTDAGYVVFAPFYRLIGEADGTPACHNATLADIVADINDAFDWVLGNQAQYGASGRPVVFGQSAGGHLALSLAVRRSAEVSSAVLFYAPTDFADFASQYNAGAYDNPQGQRIIEAVTGAALATIDTTSELIRQNSFPAIVQQRPTDFPPVFMLHGESDSLLPARQSIRLCNALAGNAEDGVAAESDSLAKVTRRFSCDDRGSELHLVGEGEHTLDLCISPELCLAGSPASAVATGAAIQRMLKWIDNPAAVNAPETNAVNGGTGRFGFPWLVAALWLMNLCVKKKKRNGSK